MDASERKLLHVFQDVDNEDFILELYQYQPPYFQDGKPYKGICKKDPQKMPDGRMIYFGIYEIAGHSEAEILQIAAELYGFEPEF